MTVITDSVQTGRFYNQDGSREFAPCTAWVNFDGTGTVAIRDSLNVSSITDNGTGDYTVNFAQAMDNNDYCPSVGGGLAKVSNSHSYGVYTGDSSSSSSPVLKDVNSVRTTNRASSGVTIDIRENYISIFGGITL